MQDTDSTASTAQTAVRTAVLKYAAYRTLSRMGFSTPFVVVFMVGQGVTYTDIALGTTAMAVVMIVTEVPSGYVGDRVGRHTTILVGQALGALGATGYLFARGTVTVVALYLAFGLSASVRSGSDTAWFYDVLVEHDSEDRYAEIGSRVGRLVNVVDAAFMVGGAALFLVDPSLAILAGTLASWACVLVVWTFPANASNGDEETTFGVRRAASATGRFLTDGAIRTVALVGALYFGAMYASSKYVQPTTLSVLPERPVVADVVVPAAVVLSLVYVSYSLVQGLVVRYGDAAADRFGVGKTILLSYGTGALCMVVPVVAPSLALPAMVGFLAIPALAGPGRSAYLNEHATAATRATTMSAISFLMSIVRIPILLVGGVVADAISPAVAMAALGAGVLAVGAVVVALDGPFTVAPSSDGATTADAAEGATTADAAD